MSLLKTKVEVKSKKLSRKHKKNLLLGSAETLVGTALSFYKLCDAQNDERMKKTLTSRLIVIHLIAILYSLLNKYEFSISNNPK